MVLLHNPNKYFEFIYEVTDKLEIDIINIVNYFNISESAIITNGLKHKFPFK